MDGEKRSPWPRPRLECSLFLTNFRCLCQVPTSILKQLAWLLRSLCPGSRRGRPSMINHDSTPHNPPTKHAIHRWKVHQCGHRSKATASAKEERARNRIHSPLPESYPVSQMPDSHSQIPLPMFAELRNQQALQLDKYSVSRCAFCCPAALPTDQSHSRNSCAIMTEMRVVSREKTQRKPYCTPFLKDHHRPRSGDAAPTVHGAGSAAHKSRRTPPSTARWTVACGRPVRCGT